MPELNPATTDPMAGAVAATAAVPRNQNAVADPGARAMVVDGLRKNFGRKQVLNGLSFSIPHGAVAGFLGTNGAGKTTTLRIVLGLIRASAGRVWLLGQEMPGARCRVMESVGAMVERPSYIDNLSGFANLWWFCNLTRPVGNADIHDVLSVVGLTEAANRPFGQYSTGMKQRLGIAAALLNRPKLILLDEPTSGMDPQGRYQMRQVFQQMARGGTTILLSSHLLDEVQKLCDYVVILQHGVTVSEGWVRDVLARDQERCRIKVPVEQVEKARQLLEKLAGVARVETSAESVRISGTPGLAVVANRALVQAGLDVAAVVPEENSLEETFINLTSDDEAASR